MTDYHPSHDDPQPAYPKHCPLCGARVYPLHYTRGADQVWEWAARCWFGHLVAALPAQLSLMEVH